MEVIWQLRGSHLRIDDAEMAGRAYLEEGLKLAVCEGH